MSNHVLFYIFGIGLAVSAVLVSLVALRVKGFPGRAFPAVVLWFVVLVGGATTFAVLYAQDEERERAAETEPAGKVYEEESEDIEADATESEGSGEEAGNSEPESAATTGGDAEAGAQVFASAGCASCHTFAAAGASGPVGPDLDEALTAGTTREEIEEDIVDPEAEVAPGYSAGIMPGTFGDSLDATELADLVEFLFANSPAGSSSK